MTTWRPDHSEDPHPLFADRNVSEPVRQGVLDGVPVWLVSGYDDVRRLLADPGVSSDVRYAGPAARAVPWLQAGNLHPLLMHMARRDPPEHTRLRKLVTKAFTSRRVEALRPRVQQITDRLIADIGPAGRADLISDFALPLPVTVIADLLGVPDLRRTEFLSWAGICAGVEEGDLARREQALAHLTGYLDELIGHKSAQRAAGTGDGTLLDGLIEVRDEGDLLSHHELLATAFLLLVAGYETTAALIGNGMLALLHHPEQLAALRADPARVAAAVEEFLRYDGPVKVTPSLRFTTAEIRVAGTRIPAGEAVLPFLSAADRDPSRFPGPATLDIGRDATGHLGFGHGVHHCLGAPLARLEAQIAFTALLTRLDGLELGPGGPSWRHSYALHSLKSLPLTFTPTPVSSPSERGRETFNTAGGTVDGSTALDLSSPDPEFSQDPYPLFAELRVQAPVRRVYYSGLAAWLLTRSEDIVRVLTDPRFSNDIHLSGPDNRDVPWLFGMDHMGLSHHMALNDPPEHTRLRRLVSKVFTPRRIGAARPMIQRTADDLVGAFAPRGNAELLSEFAWPLPSTVITELLGVPGRDRERFLGWVHAILGPGAGDPEDIAATFTSVVAYLTELIDRKRGQPAADANDILSDLVAAQERGDKLTDTELRSLSFALLAGGFETTSLLIGNGMLALLRSPEQMALLRANPDLIGQAIEEFLRYDAPVDCSMPRFAREDVYIGDTLVHAGEAVLCMFASANRDLPVTGDASRLDISRPDVRHMSFGHGVHFCLGAPLARLEGQIAFRTLLDRCQDMVLTAQPDELVKKPGVFTRRLPVLPVSFTPR